MFVVVMLMPCTPFFAISLNFTVGGIVRSPQCPGNILHGVS